MQLKGYIGYGNDFINLYMAVQVLYFRAVVNMQFEKTHYEKLVNLILIG